MPSDESSDGEMSYTLGFKIATQWSSNPRPYHRALQFGFDYPDSLEKPSVTDTTNSFTSQSLCLYTSLAASAAQGLRPRYIRRTFVGGGVGTAHWVPAAGCNDRGAVVASNGSFDASSGATTYGVPSSFMCGLVRFQPECVDMKCMCTAAAQAHLPDRLKERWVVRSAPGSRRSGPGRCHSPATLAR